MVGIPVTFGGGLLVVVEPKWAEKGGERTLRACFGSIGGGANFPFPKMGKIWDVLESEVGMTWLNVLCSGWFVGKRSFGDV